MIFLLKIAVIVMSLNVLDLHINRYVVGARDAHAIFWVGVLERLRKLRNVTAFLCHRRILHRKTGKTLFFVSFNSL